MDLTISIKIFLHQCSHPRFPFLSLSFSACHLVNFLYFFFCFLKFEFNDIRIAGFGLDIFLYDSLTPLMHLIPLDPLTPALSNPSLSFLIPLQSISFLFPKAKDDFNILALNHCIPTSGYSKQYIRDVILCVFF